MEDTRGIFKPNVLLFRTLRYRHFWIFVNMATYAVILNLNLTCYCNKATIFKYGGLVR